MSKFPDKVRFLYRFPAVFFIGLFFPLLKILGESDFSENGLPICVARDKGFFSLLIYFKAYKKPPVAVFTSKESKLFKALSKRNLPAISLDFANTAEAETHLREIIDSGEEILILLPESAPETESDLFSLLEEYFPGDYICSAMEIPQKLLSCRIPKVMPLYILMLTPFARDDSMLFLSLTEDILAAAADKTHPRIF